MSAEATAKKLERDKIYIVTDNGKMPKDGGKRIGYVCNGWLTVIGRPAINLAAKSEAEMEEQEPQIPKLSISFYDLEGVRETFRGGRFVKSCHRCVHYDFKRVTYDTDEGIQTLLECENCGTLSRS